ncbi:MAG TPA: spore coat protein U domain-containing protein [Ramlibacter sp.]|nr:spore coat protein U domain-containing protein [Ramlibacter sp.]
MQSCFVRTLLALLLSLWGEAALAQQSCTLTMNALASATNYNPFLAAFNDSSGIFSVNCTRTRGGQNRFTTTYSVRADNGLNFTTTRRLRNGAFYLNYALYRNYPTCTTAWGNTAAAGFTLNNSATGANDVTTNPNPLSGGTSYCFRITGGSSTAIPGTYTDTVQVTIFDGNGTQRGTVSVTLSTTVVPTCSVTSAPASVNLTYTSFQATAPSANSPFQLRCTNSTTFSLGFDTPVVGVNDRVQGLNYNLTTSAAGGTGTGVPQNYTVTVTVPAAQAGTCTGPGGSACTGTVSRAVQVEY